MGAFLISGLVALFNGALTGYLRRYLPLLVVAIFGALLAESAAVEPGYEFGNRLAAHLMLSLLLASAVHFAVRACLASLQAPVAAPSTLESPACQASGPGDGGALGVAQASLLERARAAWRANPSWQVYAAHALGLTVVLSTFLAVISTGAYWWAQRHSDQRALVDAARNAFNFQLTLFGVTLMLFILAPRLALFFNVFVAMPLTLATAAWNLYRVRRGKEGRYPLAVKVFKAERAV